MRLVCLVLVGALGAASTASAAPPTCYDLLVRNPERSYQCTLVTDNGVAATPVFTFSPSLNSPQFTLRVNGNDFACSCDALGSASKPKFFSSKSFTCGLFLGGNGIIVKGKVAGPDGSKIVSVQSPEYFGFASSSIGTCTLIP